MEIIKDMEKSLFNMAKTLNFKVTQQNSHNLIGRKIIYKTRDRYKCDIIKNVSSSGKTIYLTYNSDLGGNLEITGRKVYIIE